MVGVALLVAIVGHGSCTPRNATPHRSPPLDWQPVHAAFQAVVHHRPRRACRTPSRRRDAPHSPVRAARQRRRRSGERPSCAKSSSWDEGKYVRDANGKFTFKNSGKSSSSGKGGGGGGGGGGGRGGGGKAAAKKAARAKVDAEKEAERTRKEKEDTAERLRDETRRRTRANETEANRRKRIAQDLKIKAAAEDLAKRGEVARGIEAMQKSIERARSAGDDAAVAMLEERSRKAWRPGR